MLTGIVLKSTGKFYNVLLKNGTEITARIRGKIRLEGLRTTNPVAVGDKVELNQDEETTDIYTINSVLPRSNYLIRKSTNLSKQKQILASNIDRIYLVITIEQPNTHQGFIDRFLVSAEAYRIPVSIIFNKIDLYSQKSKSKMLNWKTSYEKIGYPCHFVSTLETESYGFLKDDLQGKQVLFAGNSGVGKSSLVKCIDSTIDLRIGDISDVHLLGKHTTTFAEMFPVKTGGFIIDSPGIRAFGLTDMKKEEIAHYFPEMRKLLGQCKFHNCLHMNEPHCAVKKAVEMGEIEESRYINYLQMIADQEDDIHRRNDYE
ncbi:MAG: ribosome small subunit-dependent GTPase A [Bacteroidetes bacterium]|nr:ribosome small subunit-dependent GTPase A [Bacteroidota bacterium]